MNERKFHCTILEKVIWTLYARVMKVKRETNSNPKGVDVNEEFVHLRSYD